MLSKLVKCQIRVVKCSFDSDKSEKRSKSPDEETGETNSKHECSNAQNLLCCLSECGEGSCPSWMRNYNMKLKYKKE